MSGYGRLESDPSLLEFCFQLLVAEFPSPIGLYFAEMKIGSCFHFVDGLYQCISDVFFASQGNDHDVPAMVFYDV